MKKNLIIKAIVSISVLLALTLQTIAQEDESIETLLEEYQEASQLYHKTKEEAEGQVIIYTREDLDRMQAYTLKDVLKSLRYFSLQDNNFGDHVLVYPFLYDLLNTTAKLYINNHEVNTVYQRSIFPIWGDFPLDHVDHIEIYLGETAIKFGNETPGVVIKIFTKEPSRENASYIRGSITSRKGYSLNYYDARELENGMSYMVFIHSAEIERKKYRNQDAKLSRNSSNKNAYLLLKKGNFQIEYNNFYKRNDRFLGMSIDNKPDATQYSGHHQYISATGYFLKDKSLQMNIAYDYIVEKDSEKNKEGIITINPYILAKECKEEIKQNIYRMLITKNIKYKNNDITLGFVLKDKNYRLKSYKKSITDINLHISDQNTDNLKAYFLEDEISINDKNLIIVGAKYSKYQRNEPFRSIDGYLLRFGYIFVPSQTFYGKLLASDYFTPPTFFELATNHSLKKQKNRLVGLELNFDKNNHKLKLSTAYVAVKDNITLNPATYKYINFDKKVEFLLGSIDYEYKINDENKIMLNYYKGHISKEKFIYGTSEGGFVRIFSKIKNINNFIELVFRKGYNFPISGTQKIKIKDGYDLTMGISYMFQNGVEISLKGENLLNKALKTPYLGLNPVVIPSVDQQVIFSVKAIF